MFVRVCVSLLFLLSLSEAKVTWVIVCHTHTTLCLSVSQGVNHTRFLCMSDWCEMNAVSRRCPAVAALVPCAGRQPIPETGMMGLITACFFTSLVLSTYPAIIPIQFPPLAKSPNQFVGIRIDVS